MAWPAVIHLIGPPGAGKLTVARATVDEAAERGRRIVLLDNHRTTNLIFSVIGVDGVRPIVPAVWDRVMEVREAVFRAVEDHTSSDWSLVLTNVLLAGHPADQALLERIMALASARGASYVPVELRCETEELLARVPREDRRANLKWIDVAGVRDFLRTVPLLTPDGALTIDTTSLPPSEAARKLLDHVDSLG